MTKKQLAKLTLIAGGIVTAAPQIMPLVPAAYHPHAAGILALLGFLAGYPMQSPFASKAALSPNLPKAPK